MPDAFYRFLAFPNGIAMIALGYSLWRSRAPTPRRCRPPSTDRAGSPRPVPNDPAAPSCTPDRHRSAGRVPGRVELAVPVGAGGAQPHPGHRRVTAAARDRRRPAAAAHQPAHRRLTGARGGARRSARPSTPSSARSSSPPGCVAATRAGTARSGRILVVAGLVVAGSGLWMTLFYAGAPGGDLLWGIRLAGRLRDGRLHRPRASRRSAAATSPRTAPG